MDQKKIIVIGAIAGLIILFSLSKLIVLEPISINDVDENYISKTVKVVGKVTSVTSGDNTFIYLDDSTVSFVVFDKVDIAKGQKVLIVGKVDEYDGRLTIIVDSLELI